MGSNTLNAIYLALLISPYLAILALIPYIVYTYQTKKIIYTRKSINFYMLVIFFLCAYFMTMLPFPTIEKVQSLKTSYVQLIPFRIFYDYFKDSGLVTSDITTLLPSLKSGAFLGPVFNVMMLMPIGYFLREIFGFGRRKTFLTGFCMSLLFELTQLSGLFFIYPRPYRIFDVDDLICNTAGAIVGWYLLPIVKRYSPIGKVVGTRVLKQGGGISLRRRFPAIMIDQCIALALTVILMFLLKLHWMNDFFLLMLIFMLFNVATAFILRIFHSTPGFYLCGLQLNTRNGLPLRIWQCILYMLILAVSFSLPFCMGFFLYWCGRFSGYRQVLCVFLNASCTVAYAYIMFTLILNGITHGTTLDCDRICRTYVGLSPRSKDTKRMQELMTHRLNAGTIDLFCNKIFLFLSEHGFEPDAMFRVRILANSVMNDWIQEGLKNHMCTLKYDHRFFTKTLFLIVYTHHRPKVNPSEKSHVEMASNVRLSYESYYTNGAYVFAIEMP